MDDISKIVVAVTASGSAISGWALWSQPAYRMVWAVFAGLSATIGIVHGSLGVAHRLKDWGDIKRAFAGLRVELETLQYRMKFDFKATNREFKLEFISLRRQYLSAVQRLRSDLLLRSDLKLRVQDDVNQKLQMEQKGE